MATTIGARPLATEAAADPRHPAGEAVGDDAAVPGAIRDRGPHRSGGDPGTEDAAGLLRPGEAPVDALGVSAAPRAARPHHA